MGENHRIGIFGGTFNPIHIGHLVIAEAAREEYNLEKVIFVPASHPPHKHFDIATDNIRYEMVKLAVADNPYFEVSNMELRRPGLSYTVDTMRCFHKEYPENTEFYFIVGMDTLLELPTWKYVDELIQLCHFLGALRPNYRTDLSDVLAYFGDIGRERIHYLHTPQLEISATDLRERLRKGKSVRYLMPKQVAEWLLANNVYREAFDVR